MANRYDVFLCHNQADKPAVQELADRLCAAGLEPWLDKSDLRRGVPWTEEVEKCLVEESASCAVIVGPSGLGPWQEQELRVAQNRQVEAKRTNGSFPVIPVLLPGGKLETLPPFLKGHTCVFFPKSLDDKEAFDEFVRAIRGLPPLRSRPTSDECPYRGLEFFDVAHAPYFYGREELTARLVEKLRSNSQNRAPNRFLAIVGASGSGKSSLARAGLVAGLKRGAIEGSDQWPVVICRPGSDPCVGLAVELARLGGLDLEKQAAFRDRLKDRMQREQTALDEDVRQVLSSGDSKQRLVILVDQFEELFTICRDEKLRTAFVDNLVNASHVPQGQTLVLLAMRADFYGKCATYTRLADALSERQQLIGPMTRQELQQAIEKPSQKVGCELEPGLVDLLLNDVVNDPGSLPFLQFALKELWNRKTGRKLTTEAYRGIGGVTGALQRKADEVYAGLSEQQQQICRRVFLRLTQPGEGTEDTKRRVSLRELQPTTGSMAEVEAVLFNLSESETRLITGEAENGEEFVEVAHEALIRGWPKLRSWIEIDRVGLVTQHRLTEAVNQWNENRRDPSFLYQGARLAAAKEWASVHAEQLSQLEGEFIRLSRRHAQSQQVRFVAIVALLLTAGFAGITWEWRDAVNQREETAEALQREKSALRMSNDALQNEQTARQRAKEALVREAVAHRETDRHRKSAEDALNSLRRRLRDLAVSYANHGSEAHMAADHGVGQHWYVSAYQKLEEANVPKDDLLRRGVRQLLALWSSESGTVLSIGRISSVAFSPDGRCFVTGSDDKTARLWDAATQSPIGQPMRHGGPVKAVAYSPDRQTLLTGSDDKTARLWDAATQSLIGQPMRHEGSVRAVTYSPDGRILLTGSDDKTARLWNGATQKPIGLSMRHEQGVVAVAYSPDGRTVLTRSQDDHSKTAKLWDAATQNLIGQPMPGVSASTYNRDGRAVATGTEGGELDLRNAVSAKPLKEPASLGIVGGTGLGFVNFILASQPSVHYAFLGLGIPPRKLVQINSIAFSPDGRTLLTGSEDKTARLWDAATLKPIGEVMRHEDQVLAVEFSPDGLTLLTGSSDRTARLWDAANQTVIGQPMRHEGRVHRVAFSPDGQTVLTEGEDGTVRQWNATTQFHSGQPLPHGGAVNAIAYSPDGRILLTGSSDKTARLWDAATQRSIGLSMFHAKLISSVAYSPDGKTVLTGCEDGTVRMWNASSQQPIGKVIRHSKSVEAVAYSPNGRTLLTGSGDNMARLWDAATQTSIGNPMRHEGGVLAVAYSPDGRTVLTGSADHKARLFNAATQKAIGQPMSHDGMVWSVAYSPNGRTLLTAGDDKMARLWDAETQVEIGQPLHHEEKVWSVAYSPDGRILLTGSDDKTVRLWDAVTQTPIGRPMRHEGQVLAVAYSPDGRTILTGSIDKTARMWAVAQSVPDNVERTRLWVESSTGYYCDAQLRLQPLNLEDLLNRRGRLAAFGGPPVTRIASIAWHRHMVDLSEHHQKWFATAFHLKYLIDAEPSVAAHHVRRSKAFAEQEKWQNVIFELNTAYTIAPSSEVLRLLVSAHLGSGNQSAFRDSCRNLFQRDGESKKMSDRDEAAWLAVQSPLATTDWTPYVTMAQELCEKQPSRADYHETFGASLLRARRFSDAVTELGKAIEFSKDNGTWSMHLFLAMAQAERGETENAREHLKAAEPKFADINAPDWTIRLQFRLLHEDAVQLLAQRIPVNAKRPQRK